MKTKHLFISLLVMVVLISGCVKQEAGNQSINQSEGEPAANESQKFCGDGICDGPETAEDCPQDCEDELSQPESSAASEYSPPEPIIVTEKREPLAYTGGMNIYTFNYIPNAGKNSDELYNDINKLNAAKTTSAELCERNSALGEKYGIIWGRDAPGFRRDVIEYEKGKFNFNITDTWMLAASNHGINLIGTLNFHSKEDRESWPEYATLPPAGFSPEFPKDTENYAKMVELLVERYDGDGVNDMPGLNVGIKYWEIGNEADYFTGEEQLRITKITYDAVKKSCPDCKLMNGGATVGEVPRCRENPNNNCSWMDFFKLGGGEYIDVISIHWGLEKREPFTSEERLFEYTSVLDYFGNLAKTYARKDIPIWLTEFEVPSQTTTEEQKAWVVKRMSQGLAHGVEKFFPAFIVDTAAGLPNNIKSSIYLINPETEELNDYYYAMARLEDNIKGFNRIDIISKTKYKFIFDTKILYVLWTEDEDKSIPAEITGTVTLIDILNNQESVVDASSITLTSEPIIIEV